MAEYRMKILLCTDGSADAELGARAAATLSGGSAAELHVVHVMGEVSPLLYPAGAPAAEYLAVFEERGRDLLAREVGKIRRLGGDVAGSHLRKGRPADQILDLAEELEASLIVLGSRGRGPVERLLLGSVSEEIVHHASHPVMVVRGGEGAWPPRRVVFGDDGSESARAAGDLAASIGRLFGARGILVRAFLELPEADLEARISDPRLVADARRRAERELEERATELQEKLGERPRIRMTVGDAARALLEAAEEGDGEAALIAVGRRGVGRMKRLWLGSVSTKVIRAARGSVLVCPPPP
ncbi:MAG: universal stress protein [Rubrobacter sp.]|nr:universal stress protein [Rubrobacter sp.]